ncbi:MAG: transglutaminase domain-containing protein, partial [Gammaproteobacteria bacterium]|nr:transglutaminase domain-containing protein [Gammaproteobacteria bacterium]
DRGYAPPGEGRGGTLYRVRLELEPYPHDWLIGLDRPESADLADVRRTTDGLLVLPGRRSPPQEVVITSRLGAEPLPQESLPTQLRRRDLGYPPGRDPRTGAFAGELRRLHPQDLDLVAAVLAMFHQEPFYYTLTPPQLGRDAVDEFLFVTRRGFCEHYASAFAALMRAAGIPARVVTGYYGGRYNGYSQEWIVRQSDAHAWDEIWLAGRGWVRVDPTAAIDPARIDPGLRDLARTPGGFAASTAGAAGWTADLELRFDALRMLWRDRILNYDGAAQRALLSGLGVARPDDAGLAAALALSFALGLAWLAFESRRALAVRPRDELQRAFRRLEARLARIGLPRLPHEGPQAYAKRVGERRADLAGEVARLCAEYAALRYGPATSSARVRALAAAVRSFRPRRSRGWRENRSPPSAPR